MTQGEICKNLPIAYTSRTLNKSEHNNSTSKLKCFQYTLEGNNVYLIYECKCIILSDHKPFKWIFNFKNPLSKIARYRIQLEDFNNEIKYKPEVKN